MLSLDRKNRERFINDPELIRKADTLLHLSGGQDSTYVAWKWLVDNPDRVLFIHHINLYHKSENRLYAENEAVQKILKWFKRNRIRNFVYYESDFSYGNLPRISIKDIQICTVFSSIILRTPSFRNIKTLLLSWHKGEVNDPGINRGYRVKALLKAFEIEGINLEFPISEMTRRQMADDMPADLLKLAHTCRKPDMRGACGKCKTCMEMKEAGIFRG